MTIEKLQALTLSKIAQAPLKKAVTDLLEDYKNTTDKNAFKDIAKENIEKVYQMVEKLSPDAIVKPTSKKEEAKKTSKPKRSVQKELGELSEDIKICRAKIRKYNEEKRKNEPKKPKPNRHTRIKKHFIAIINLMPPELKENKEVLDKAEKVLLKAHRDIMNAYQMNIIKAEAVQKAIKRKYQQLEDKIPL